MQPYQSSRRIKPRLLSNDQFEGYLAYYGYPYELDNKHVYITRDTIFAFGESQEVEMFLPQDFIEPNSLLARNRIGRVGIMNSLELDDIGAKIVFTITNKKLLDIIKRLYLEEKSILSIVSYRNSIKVNEFDLIEHWPVISLYFVNVPFSPELN